MGLLTDAALLRKLGNFLAGLFPGLGAAWDRALETIGRRLGEGRTGRALAFLRGTRLFAALGAIADRFWWSNYRKDRADLRRLHPEGAAVLTSGLALSALLCLTLPLAAALPLPALTLPGSDQPVAAWSPVLVALALAAARALILAGAACANRLVLVPAALLDLYLAFGLGTLDGRSWTTLLAPWPALVALAASERALARPTRKDRAAGLASALVVGVGCGVFWSLTLPISAGVGPVKLAWGAAGGVLLGLAALLIGRRTGPRPSATRLAGALLALEIATAATAMARAGLGAYAARDAALANLAGGLLWPLWYFAGVGIVFKLLGNAKAVTGALRGFFPGRRLAGLVLVLLLAANLLLWGPTVLDSPLAGWPGFVVQASMGLYALGRGIWTEPGAAATAEIVRWLLLAELGWALLQLARRRLDDALAGTLLFTAVLGTLGAWEYVFQQQGFLRSGPHTVLATAAFAVWLVWLLQKVGMLLGQGDSPRWPAPARLTLLAGLLVLVLAQVHAAGARRDPAYANEVFLTLYRAFVDVGLPYALYVWAGRNLALPATGLQLLAAFVGGALLTLPMHLIDRLALVGGDTAAMMAVARARGEALLGGRLHELFTDPAPPFTWLALRGLLILGAAALLGAVVERRRAGRPDAVPGAVALVLAASAGFASFTRTMLDLPLLPASWIALVAPARQTYVVDAHVLGSYLVWTLPALLLALAASRLPGGRSRWLAALVPGYAVHLVAALAWPTQEAFLRSTGTLWTLGLAGTAAMVWAFGAVRTESSSRRERALIAAAALGFAAWLGVQAHAGRAEPRRIEGFGALAVPARYESIPAPPGTAAAFRNREPAVVRPVLLVSVTRRRAGDPVEAMETALAQSAALPAFEARPATTSPTALRIPGAELRDYSFEGRLENGTTFPVVGSTFALSRGEQTLLVTWLGPPAEFDRSRWDLLRIAEESGLLASPECGWWSASGCTESSRSAIVAAAARVPGNLPDKRVSSMHPIETVLATLLETWNQRYTFKLDREQWSIRFSIPGFDLVAREQGNEIELSFEEAGSQHRVVCPSNEAPKVIEALLFPE